MEAHRKEFFIVTLSAVFGYFISKIYDGIFQIIKPNPSPQDYIFGSLLPMVLAALLIYVFLYHGKPDFLKWK